MEERHLQKRLKCVTDYETNIHEILKQCSPNFDVLYVNFRYDEICLALDRFRQLGITLKTLLEFQLKVNCLMPWNVEYSSMRLNVNRRFNFFPLLIIMAECDEDIIQAYQFAQKYKIEISLRSGSHCFENFSLCTGMVIDQSRRTRVRIDPETKTYTMEAGALIGPVVDALSKYSLAIPVGSCVNNGLSLFSCGGGVSYLNRFWGTNSDNIIEAQILLADGKIHTVNSRKHKDLYFALRGAGIGNYGIVVSLKCQAYEIADVYIFTLTYKFSDLEEILPRWTNWITTIPLNLTSDITIIGGKGNIYVNGYYLGSSKCKLEAELEQLTRFVAPSKTFIEKTTFVNGIRAFAGKGRWYPFFKFKNGFLKSPWSVSSPAISIIREFMSQGDEHNYLTIDSLGGALDKTPARATAFVHRFADGWCHFNAQWFNQEQAAEKLGWTQKFYKELAPYLSFETYQNAPDITLDHYLERYYGENLPRLVRIKRKYDPKNIFQYEQSIPPVLPSVKQN